MKRGTQLVHVWPRGAEQLNIPQRWMEDAETGCVLRLGRVLALSIRSSQSAYRDFRLDRAAPSRRSMWSGDIRSFSKVKWIIPSWMDSPLRVTYWKFEKPVLCFNWLSLLANGTQTLPYFRMEFQLQVEELANMLEFIVIATYGEVSWHDRIHFHI